MTGFDSRFQSQTPDILTCIANLSNDAVTTPPSVAIEMLDTLQMAWADANGGSNLWEDPTVKFLDPFTKSGVFLREIVSRLIEGLETKIPNLQERVDHILSQQVYGIATENLTAHMSRRTVYCSKRADGPHSITQVFNSEEGNIWFQRKEHSWAGSVCKYCKASKAQYDRGPDFESYAYAFIHTDNISQFIAQIFGDKMKFDVIIGNPPYHLTDSGHGSSATPIYQRFVEQAKALDPRFVSMIIPARWYTSGKGLEGFRRSMLSDNKIRYLHDYPNTADVFPRDVNNRGGVCYFLWDRDYSGDAQVSTHEGNAITSVMTRPLLAPGHDKFIRYNEGISILEKVLSVEYGREPDTMLPPSGRKFSDLVSSRNPFGLPTNFIGREAALKDDLKVFRNGGTCYASADQIEKGHGLVNEHKIFIARSSPGSDEYPHLVLSAPIIAGPQEVATDTYIAIGPFSSEEEARNVAEYMSTTFFRFMLSLLRTSINVSKTVYALVPMQDFTQRWSDQDLADKYGLSEDDFIFMNRFVKPVRWAGSYA